MYLIALALVLIGCGEEQTVAPASSPVTASPIADSPPPVRKMEKTKKKKQARRGGLPTPTIPTLGAQFPGGGSAPSMERDSSTTTLTTPQERKVIRSEACDEAFIKSSSEEKCRKLATALGANAAAVINACDELFISEESQLLCIRASAGRSLSPDQVLACDVGTADDDKLACLRKS